MSDRVYTCEFEGLAVTAAVDLFELSPADDKPIEVLGLFLSQSSDVGDAAEEILRFRVVRGNTTTGTGGTQAATPRPVNATDAAAGFTYDTGNTTAASAGTAVNLHSDGFNIRTGYGLWLPDGCEWSTNQTTGFIVVRLMAAPADSVTLSGTMYVRELG